MFKKKDIQIKSSDQETKPEQCQACPVALKAFTKFCPECGKNLIAPKEPLPEQVKPAETTTAPERKSSAPVKDTTDQPDPAQKCGSCGHEIASDVRFCSQCGSKAVKKSAYNIVCKCKDKTELTASITTDEFIIGQAEDCDMAIPDNYLSRHHTRLFLSKDKLMMEDMGSSNGTFVRIREPMVLVPEDEILIGANILTVKA